METPWVALVPLITIVLLTAALGAVRDHRRGGSRSALLNQARGAQSRARAVVRYHVHVQDSVSG